MLHCCPPRTAKVLHFPELVSEESTSSRTLMHGLLPPAARVADVNGTDFVVKP